MPALRNAETFGTVRAVGQKLFTEFLLPFEVTSLLLLVAIVGAVVVAKERI
jgi:NADH-quinone oxidoreductase subunit J